MIRLLLLTAFAIPAIASEPCKILVTDAENGWPVPQVELRTTHNLRFYTDNAGVVAIDAPELLGRETWFHISSDGYEVAADGFGYRGRRLTPMPGGTIEVEVTRTSIAKRLGRLTGAGLFGESQKLGAFSSWKDSGVFGCDSVQNAIHDGRLFWAWGDTNLAKYPLGIFHMTGATTSLQPLKNFEPPLQLEYDYFRSDDGAPRAIAEMEGPGPTWLSGFASLPDASGGNRFVAHYIKVKPPLTAYRSGLCFWNEKASSFEHLETVWEMSDEIPDRPLAPEGHPVRWSDEEGVEWMLFGDPFPHLMTSATFEGWCDSAQWIEIDAPVHPVSADGETVEPHRGSIVWNKFRNRWVAIFCEKGGEPSPLGEIWYAEADSPFGPWGTAVKVLSHRNYTFYNPKIHPGMVPDDSPVLLFEGTYTKTFSNAPVATPRYDYNQILYRIDLDDLALKAAQ